MLARLVGMTLSKLRRFERPIMAIAMTTETEQPITLRGFFRVYVGIFVCPASRRAGNVAIFPDPVTLALESWKRCQTQKRRAKCSIYGETRKIIRIVLLGWLSFLQPNDPWHLTLKCPLLRLSLSSRWCSRYKEMARMSGLPFALLILFTKLFAADIQLLLRSGLFGASACNREF